MIAHDDKGQVRNLEDLRVERDRQITLEYLLSDRVKGRRGIVPELMEKHGFKRRRIIYEIVDRNREWAEKEITEKGLKPAA